MAAITVATITELRNRTNAGMMDCKKALMEANGDMEEAIKVLRAKGQAVQVKRADKEAKQGLIAACSCDKCGATAMVEVNCETDFVAKTEGFQNFVKKAVELAVKGEADISAVMKDDIGDLVAKTGENTIIRRAERYTLQGTGKIQSYIHMGGKIGVLVELGCERAETVDNPAFSELVFDVALQIAALAPRFMSGADVPQADIDAEIEVKLNAMKEQKGKLPPEGALAGIKKGMAQKFFSEICLLDQLFVKNEPGVKKSVAQIIDDAAKKLGDKIVVRRYTRFQLGA